MDIIACLYDYIWLILVFVNVVLQQDKWSSKKKIWLEFLLYITLCYFCTAGGWYIDIMACLYDNMWLIHALDNLVLQQDK